MKLNTLVGKKIRTIWLTNQTSSNNGNLQTRGGNNPKFTTINFYDAKHNIIIKSKIFDSDQKVVNTANYRYKKVDGKLDLDLVYSQTYAPDSKGRIIRTVADYYFKNMKVVQ